MKRFVFTLVICLGCMGILGAQHVWKPLNCNNCFLGADSDGNLFAMAGYGGLLRSQDDGETWTQSSDYYMTLFMAFSPNGRLFIFPSDYTFVCYSDDHGDTWQQTATHSFSNYNMKGAYAVNNDTLLLWGENHLHYTLDAGATWQDADMSFIGDEYHQIGDVIANETGDVYVSKWYYSGWDSGIFHSTLSDMQDWTLAAFDGAVVLHMEFDPEGNVVAGSYWGGLSGFHHEPGFYLVGGQTMAVSDNGIIYKLRYTGDLEVVLNYSTDHGEHFFDVGEALEIYQAPPGGGDDGSIYKGHDNHLYFHGNNQYYKSLRDANSITYGFAPQGAEWYFNLSSFMTSPISYYRMAVEGDTLIQGHQCSVITRQYLSGNGDEQYVYEENNKVYWYNATMDAFTTLYDFDAEEGESWICHIDSCSYEVTVQSVEQVTWEGRTYRVQNIAPVEGEFFYFYYGRIIEGIGSVEGLFPYPYACVGDMYDGPYPDYLRCYLVDGEMLYHEGDFGCDAVLPWQYPCWDGTVAEAYDGGNGTAEDPYQIATPQQLALLAQQTNNGTGGDAYYLLTDDICLNASLEMWTFNWEPIGRVTDSTVAYFRGHFDGNGKTISKLYYITNELMTDPVVGLFGCTDGAEIVNVNLSDCWLNGGEYVGGLVGYAGATDIANCSVQYSQITTTGGVAGGIVGYAGMPFRVQETNENVSKLTNCRIELVTVESVVDAGGIVGKVNNDAFYARYLVSNCSANNEQYFHVKGSVSGGIVGEMRYGTVEGCASKTIVVGTGQVSNVCVGGIAGSIHGSSVIANSYYRGNVVTDFEVAGGIVGYSAGDIYNVYNAGEIYTPDPNGNGYGTIVGNVQAGERLNCYWLENNLPSAGNPILPDMPGSTSFHQGATSTSWVLDEAQYGTVDLVEALNAGASEIESLYPGLEPVRRWKHDDKNANGGFPVFENTAGMQIFNGSEWYYEILNENGSITYQYLYLANDTVIDDENIHIIVKVNTLYDKQRYNEVTHEYIYVRDGKVYWWNKTLQEFTVLYDFSAEAGDEWEIKVGTANLLMHVDSVEWYEYEGKVYKMLHVSDADDLFSGDIVCGIGHLTSFFPEKLMSKNHRVEGIRCFWKDGNLVFQYGDHDCDEIYIEYHTDVDEMVVTNKLRVHPNPTNGIIVVETSPSAFLQYRITNLMGQILLTGRIDCEKQQIDVSALPSGIYFLNVGERSGKIVVL